MIENLPGEEWRDVPGYEAMYRVSSMGRVLSLLRKMPAIVKGNPNMRGYLQVQFRKDGERKAFLVHRLVMLAFNPNENAANLEVNHIDFNIHNCSLTNLEWTTSAENWRHSVEKGKKGNRIKSTGANHHLSRLADADVLEIRRLCAVKQHGTKRAVAKKFGINIGTVDQIVSGKTWRHLLPVA